jgi:hypothetical protein
MVAFYENCTEETGSVIIMLLQVLSSMHRHDHYATMTVQLWASHLSNIRQYQMRSAAGFIAEKLAQGHPQTAAGEIVSSVVCEGSAFPFAGD